MNKMLCTVTSGQPLMFTSASSKKKKEESTLARFSVPAQSVMLVLQGWGRWRYMVQCKHARVYDQWEPWWWNRHMCAAVRVCVCVSEKLGYTLGRRLGVTRGRENPCVCLQCLLHVKWQHLPGPLTTHTCTHIKLSWPHTFGNWGIVWHSTILLLSGFLLWEKVCFILG